MFDLCRKVDGCTVRVDFSLLEECMLWEKNAFSDGTKNQERRFSQDSLCNLGFLVLGAMKASTCFWGTLVLGPKVDRNLLGKIAFFNRVSV